MVVDPGVIWSVLLTIEGDPSLSVAQIWTAGFAFGAINGAVGVGFTWGLTRMIHVLFEWVHDRALAKKVVVQ